MTWTPDSIGGRDTPKRLFHGTSREALASILAQGLLPRRPRDSGRWGTVGYRDWAEEREPACAVFLTPRLWEASRSRTGRWSWSTFGAWPWSSSGR